MFIGAGTIANTATVALGATLGLLFRRGIPDRLRTTITQALALVTFFLAIRMMGSIGAGYLLHIVAAVIVGAIIGELMRLEQGLEWVAGRLKSRFAASASETTFVEGFVVASLVFCVGPMTLLGTFEDAMGRTPLLLYTKSAMDGILAIALAASLGRGVLFSALFVLIFQGILTAIGLVAGASQIPPLYEAAIRSTGGVVILSIGLLLLDVVRIRVANLLPALPLACLLLYLWPREL